MKRDKKKDAKFTAMENELQQFRSRNDLSRREFLQYAGALGITATTAGAIWSSPALASPKHGGHLRIGAEGGATTDSLDPRRAIGTAQSTVIIHSMFDTLTNLDENSTPVPRIAESWEATPDALTWRFKIRKDIEFHNGKTLGINDIISTYAYLDHDANTHGDGRNIAGSIADMKADGDYLVITQEAPNADLPTLLSGYSLTIGPAGTEGSQWEKGIGTGPYKLVNFEPGVNAEVERNPNHYDPNEGFFDSVEFPNIQDQAARASALRTDAVDYITRPDPKTAHLLAKEPGLLVVDAGGNRHYTMPMRSSDEPLSNTDLQLALKYSVDREELLKKILGGWGYVGNDIPIGRAQRYVNKDLAQRGPDPDKAQFHLKKAGMSSFDVDLYASDAAWTGAVDAAQLVTETAKKGGVNITVKRAPADGYWSEVWMQKPWCLSYWGGRPTEDWMFTVGYSETDDGKPSGWNESYFTHDRFNELLRAARGELDDDKRRSMYYEMQEICHNECGTVIPMFSSFVDAYKDTLRHANPLRSTFDLDDFKLPRQWWFET